MNKLLSLLSILFLFVLISCQKDFADITLSDLLTIPTPEPGQVAGRIVLPQGSKLDTTGMEVLTAIGSTRPSKAGTFAIDTTSQTSTTLLMNQAGEVLLMGYNYPGQPQSNLSAESTALALLMNTPIAHTLTLPARQEMIRKITTLPAFGKLVQQITLALQAGRPVTDTTNTALITALAEVFKQATNLRLGATQELAQSHSYSVPITIKTVNAELLLQNNKVAHTYVAGIYRDEKNIAYHTINGAPRFAASLSDAAMAVYGDGYGIPEPVLYSMSVKGEYRIKIRSGKPGADDDSAESKRARRENVYFYLANLVLTHAPLPANSKCSVQLAVKVSRFVKDVVDKNEARLASANSPTILAGLLLDISSGCFDNLGEVLESCTGSISEDTFKFLDGVGKVLRPLNVASKIMTAANIIPHTNDLFQAVSAIDTCFQVVDQKTFKCGEEITYLVKPGAGNEQEAEPGKPLPKALEVLVTYEDGKPARQTEVFWEVKEGDGKVSAGSTVTSNAGTAQITWTLGKEGPQKLEAYVNKKKESKSALFTATAYKSTPYKLAIQGGSNQQGQPNTALNSILSVIATDSRGAPTPGVKVQWRVFAGGGKVLLSETTTDEKGIATNGWQLGPSGDQKVEAIARKADGNYLLGAPLYFTATIQKGKLAELIIGKWKAVRFWGVREGVPYDDFEDGYLIFRNDGTGVDIVSGNESKFQYRIDEASSQLSAKYDNDPKWDTFDIKELTIDKFIFYGKYSSGYEYSEFKRISGSGNTGRVLPKSGTSPILPGTSKGFLSLDIRSKQ
jgi:hypothetical protein